MSFGLRLVGRKINNDGSRMFLFGSPAVITVSVLDPWLCVPTFW